MILEQWLGTIPMRLDAFELVQKHEICFLLFFLDEIAFQRGV